MAALLLAGTSIPLGSCRFRWRTTAPDIDAGGWTRESDAAAVAEHRLDITAVARWFATFIKRLEMPQASATSPTGVSRAGDAAR
jgi:hypothetical protein